jgi:hypothetical protein
MEECNTPHSLDQNRGYLFLEEQEYLSSPEIDLSISEYTNEFRSSLAELRKQRVQEYNAQRVKGRGDDLF